MTWVLFLVGLSSLLLSWPAYSCPTYACDYELKLLGKFPSPLHPGFAWARSRYIQARAEVLAASPSKAGLPLCSFPVGARINLVARAGAAIDLPALHGGVRVLLSTRWSPPGGGSLIIQAVLE